MAVATTMPFRVFGSLETGTRRAAGAVLFVSTQAKDPVGTSTYQDSCERSVRPCHFVSVDDEVVANISDWDFLGVCEARAQKKNEADQRKAAHDCVIKADHRKIRVIEIIDSQRLSGGLGLFISSLSDSGKWQITCRFILHDFLVFPF